MFGFEINEENMSKAIDTLSRVTLQRSTES